MNHEPSDCNRGHGCGGYYCTCPCHFDSHAEEEDEEGEKWQPDRQYEAGYAYACGYHD